MVRNRSRTTADQAKDMASLSPVLIPAISAEFKADAVVAEGLIVDIEAKLPAMCEGVQNRLATGSGVRECLEIEFLAQIGVALTDAGVKAVINIIALIGAFSKTHKGPGCHRGVTRCTSTNRLPFHKSKITKQKPTTYWTKRRVLSITRRIHNARMRKLVQIIIASYEEYRSVGDEMDIDVESMVR
jgi:hypothetical protein